MNSETIGNIVVHLGMPPQDNPYRGSGRRVLAEPVTLVTGDERGLALGAFLRGKGAGAYTFWHTPPMGPAKRFTTPPNIDAATMDYYWDADGGPK